MTAIETCRTAALGGHVEQCDTCGHQRIAYNSCANRHCPKCQSLARAAWIEHRPAELLDVPVLPRRLYRSRRPRRRSPSRTNAWSTASSSGPPPTRCAPLPPTRGTSARRSASSPSSTPGARPWSHHPHLHCVIPGGGLSPDGTRWVACRPDFFLPVRVLSRLFRRLFLQGLQAAYDAGTLRFVGTLEPLRDPQAWAQRLTTVRQTEWVVYAKRPFAGPQQVLDYVGRYTHRVAISNDRLLDMDDGHVRFTYKDYRADPQHAAKTMTLAAAEFIRRFLLHVLPRASTAFATTASWARATAEPNWLAVGNFSGPQRRQTRWRRLPRPPTIATAWKR